VIQDSLYIAHGFTHVILQREYLSNREVTVSTRPEPTLATGEPLQGNEAFRLLVESVKDYAIFLLDPTGRVMSWNAGAEALKGYKSDEIIGKHFSTFYPEEAVKTGWPRRELEIATAEGRFVDEGWRVRKDGSRFWAVVVITALRDSNNQLYGFAKVTRDTTQQREFQDRIQQLNTALRSRVEQLADSKRLLDLRSRELQRIS